MVKLNKVFIKQAYAYIEAIEVFENITKEDILEMYTELDCVNSLLMSLGITDSYSNTEILKDFEVHTGMGGEKYILCEGNMKGINILSIINEIHFMYKND